MMSGGPTLRQVTVGGGSGQQAGMGGPVAQQQQGQTVKKKKETISESAGRQQKKKIERQEEKLKNNNRDLSMFPFCLFMLRSVSMEELWPNCYLCHCHISRDCHTATCWARITPTAPLFSSISSAPCPSDSQSE
ncbi:histone chaperone ASF1 [Sarotherodon galilaeus]